MKFLLVETNSGNNRMKFYLICNPFIFEIMLAEIISWCESCPEVIIHQFQSIIDLRLQHAISMKTSFINVTNILCHS